jgi:UDP-N-acetylglucosamine--N-acetylmuramyl-(pentapeptide) pyrophosphoryl-undecaprenol N-acetylglucosamine transferase
MTAGAVLWVGGEDSMEGEIISRQSIPYQAIPAAGLHGVSLRNLPGNVSLLIRGYRKAGEIIRSFRPDVLLFTGGYLAVPAAFAGRSLPSLVFIPDIEPGLAIKTISNLVSEIAVSVEETRSFTPAKKPVEVSGYPVREELLSWSKERACEVFDLDPSQPILLVFGGSKGARSINYALMKILPALLKEMQVVHITGNLDWQDIKEKTAELNEDDSRKYRVYPFLHEKMGAALRSADLVVSRSGASILGEYPMFGLPAILVPYPHAWRYQKTNADYLVRRGAAELIQDADLNEELYDRIQLLMKDPQKLSQMRDAMKRLAKPDAARTIAERLFSLAGYIPGGEK